MLGIVGFVQPRPDPESTGLMQNASSTAYPASTAAGADTVLAHGVAELRVQASWIQISNRSMCDARCTPPRLTRRKPKCSSKAVVTTVNTITD